MHRACVLVRQELANCIMKMDRVNTVANATQATNTKATRNIALKRVLQDMRYSLVLQKVNAL